MTKTVALLPLAVLLLATAAAHGAPEPRPFDVRVVADEVPGDYGAATGVVPSPLDEGAWDLLALDTREAHLPDGRPALVLRVIAQTNTASADRSIQVSFVAGGALWEAAIMESAGVFSAVGAERLEGPVDVGDGHPKAWDLWLDASGMDAGTTLEDIRVRSLVGETPADDMPGTWYVQGLPVPYAAPGVPPGTEVPPASHTLRGPAAVLTASAEVLEEGDNRSLRIELGEGLGVPQFVNIHIEGPNTPAAPVGILLEANATRGERFVLDEDMLVAGSTTPFVVTVSSDMGGYGQFRLNVTGPAPAPTPTPTETDHPHDEKAAPGIALIGAMGALATVAALRGRAA